MFHLVIAGIDGYDGGRDAAAFARALEPEELHLVSAYPVDSTRTRAARPVPRRARPALRGAATTS